MDIVFANRKLRKLCNSAARLNRKFGSRKSKKIQQHLFDLAAAPTLAAVSHLPPLRCHELKGERVGQFAVDTVHPYRIIFEPAEDPIPYSEDGSFNRSQVRAICILEVNEDYHG